MAHSHTIWNTSVCVQNQWEYFQCCIWPFYDEITIELHSSIWTNEWKNEREINRVVCHMTASSQHSSNSMQSYASTHTASFWNYNQATDVHMHDQTKYWVLHVWVYECEIEIQLYWPTTKQIQFKYKHTNTHSIFLMQVETHLKFNSHDVSSQTVVKH